MLNNQDLSRQIDEATDRTYIDIYADMPTFNVFCVGKSGSGKTTLLNAVFGKELGETGIGQPVTKKN